MALKPDGKSIDPLMLVASANPRFLRTTARMLLPLPALLPALLLVVMAAP